ncbi:hypothetical protein PUN28_003019 [Cardiocondyla obscurior]|uniref:Uncharacterized protein n=1 Tax=Cardiocondyla obscurior TaxID=286306 RepID=A0AAW2GX43_9HYME
MFSGRRFPSVRSRCAAESTGVKVIVDAISRYATSRAQKVRYLRNCACRRQRIFEFSFLAFVLGSTRNLEKVQA